MCIVSYVSKAITLETSVIVGWNVSIPKCKRFRPFRIGYNRVVKWMFLQHRKIHDFFWVSFFISSCMKIIFCFLKNAEINVATFFLTSIIIDYIFLFEDSYLMLKLQRSDLTYFIVYESYSTCHYLIDKMSGYGAVSLRFL